MINIYVATQKKIPFNLAEEYKPIFVGAALKPDGEHYGYLMDNVGENISEKNKTFCELTALYWMWKNSDADVLGLAHYRRYLSKYSLTNNPMKIANVNDYENLLENCDLIVPKKTCLWGTVENQYANGQHIKDYILCGEIIRERYPEYYDDFDKVSKSDSIYICNMFVGKRKLISDYCEWLFSILFELESKVDLTNYTVSEQRIFGYLSERLFNVWIRHNNPIIKEMFILNTELGLRRRVINAVHTFNYKVLGIDVMKHSAKRVAAKNKKVQKQ